MRQEELQFSRCCEKNYFILFKLDILIIAEFWPSLVIGLESSPSNKLWIHCKGLSKDLLAIFTDRVDWVEESEVLARNRSPDVILIQGSGKYLEQILDTFRQNLES